MSTALCPGGGLFAAPRPEVELHEITSLSLTRCFESVHQMPDYSGFPLCLVKQAAVTCLTETDLDLLF